MNRRTFLRSLSGLFVAAAAAPVVEPLRRVWQVSADAPVPRLRVGAYDAWDDGSGRGYWYGLDSMYVDGKLAWERERNPGTMGRLEAIDEMRRAGLISDEDARRMVLATGDRGRDAFFGIDASSYRRWLQADAADHPVFDMRDVKLVPVSGSQAALYHEYEMHRQRLLEAAADHHAFGMRDAINAIPKDRLAEAWKLWQERNG